MSVLRSYLWLCIPLALALSGCIGLPVGIQGSGVSKTETRTLGEFHAVSHNVVGDVSIQIGQPQSVQVTFDDNLLEIVETSVVDGELRIGTKDSYNSQVGLKIQITVPSLDELKLTSVGSINVTGFEGESLKISQSGVGKVQVEGKTKSLDLTVSGVGSADLLELKAETVKVVVSGVGSATVFASESVDANTSGVGKIKVHGNPKEQKSKSDGIGKVSFE
jgi:hypothetical protein